MRTARAWWRVLLVVFPFVFTGCVTEPAPPPRTSASVTPAFEQSHDHADPALHAYAEGLERIAYHNLVPGTNGTHARERGAWLNTEIVIARDRAFIGYMNAPWLVAIVDVNDARAPVLAGTVPFENAFAVDVAATPDGAWAVVSVAPGPVMGSLFDTTFAAKHSRVPGEVPPPGVALVDARDPAAPTLAGYLPVHGMGPHTAVVHEYAPRDGTITSADPRDDARVIVFANKAEFGVTGNGILIAELAQTVNGSRALVPLTYWSHRLLDPLVYPHDVDVQEHPLTGQVLLYVAYWDAGLVILDVTEPEDPRLVSAFTDYPAGEEVQLHDVHPFPRLVGGRHYTFTTPEVEKGSTSGRLRVHDTTDPANPRLIGSWTLPGHYVVDEPFVFTTHNFQFLPDGRIALAHGHAGVWVIDWLGPGGLHDPDPAWARAPRAVAYAVPHAEGADPPEWTPVVGTPWAWGTAVDAKGNVWVTDVTSGLHAYRPHEEPPTAAAAAPDPRAFLTKTTVAGNA